jgi:hypothetical protein
MLEGVTILRSIVIVAVTAASNPQRRIKIRQ